MTSKLGWDADELRTRFTQGLSDMYRAEVPLYGDLIRIVREVDSTVLKSKGKNVEELPLRNQIERHGAIRLGTDFEMRTVKRLFRLFNMHPVGYYDLKVAGLPLHGTAFRPLDEGSLSKNPFRIFTTVLRRDLLSSKIQQTVDKILGHRSLFTPRLCEIMNIAEEQKMMTSQEANDLITEALKIFGWHSRSTVSIEDYLELKREHPTVADIACFPSAHINHLTPRTLDIELVQQEMIRQGLPAKEMIEGPPPRKCPILLRQTSFKALEENVEFANADGSSIHGTHTARFGEVEQRGAAVTRKGRELYDQLLAYAVRNAANVSDISFSDILFNAFREFPDSWEELRVRGLVCFRYSVTPLGKETATTKPQTSLHISLARLLSLGWVEYEPITYEDFLPLSAAGIFKSNLPYGPVKSRIEETASTSTGLEAILGCKILDEIEFYHALQDDSIESCRKLLCLEEIIQEC
ncbi:hypothetical protein N7457_006981 [Penicillium paradoxum]|uniref:uncharacterized protein n=1 Tax=Penicillium paradoxum TaxID=176176 RepID=UPI00254671DF|nr:uncharacterized protein N7457_006981 [Penicillium paradoxum]KAJ5779261.1 hypothetical protein N7457_006981 [Penicillium paradoxum]